MASRRALLRISPRALLSPPPSLRRYDLTGSISTCNRPTTPKHNPSNQIRWHSKPALQSKPYSFDEVCLSHNSISYLKKQLTFLRKRSKRWSSTRPKTASLSVLPPPRSLLSTRSKLNKIPPDVREPEELASTGWIPTAINIPIASCPDALYFPPDEFEEQLGFAKPDEDKEVVFYCKAGVRSSAAAGMALQYGYQRVGEYRGSWLEWVGKGGEVQREE